jgi:hypothetical protein
VGRPIKTIVVAQPITIFEIEMGHYPTVPTASTIDLERDMNLNRQSVYMLDIMLDPNVVETNLD